MHGNTPSADNRINDCVILNCIVLCGGIVAIRENTDASGVNRPDDSIAFDSNSETKINSKLKVFDYIAKPFSLAQLRQVLKNAIGAFGLGRTLQDRLRERLGHSIKMLRVERDWSLKDLATHTRLSVSQISAIERGANLPSIESFLAIARAFEKKPSEILASIDF